MSEYLKRQVDRITYGNFKGEVERVQGIERERVYHKVWAALLDLESLDPELDERESDAPEWTLP